MNNFKKIVFVEDDPDVRDLIDMALNVVGGLEATGFASGADAVEEASDCEPQLILLDVMMPDMDGPTTLKNLRTQPKLANVPVTFLTAKVHPKEIERLRSMGVDAVLAKPFDPMTLAADLQTIWEESKA
ncbi:response regulator [Roseovarius sp. 2305UL8-3]|uniref:response regulator n=1 Tax=Roseovarius conchicola TaxID=3121636 RepID=UPI003527700B